MRLSSDGFDHGDAIPGRNALCVPRPETHVAFGQNLSPHLTWSDVPEESRSLALIGHDADAPTRPDDVNQEDREVPSDLPRGEFIHWVMVDLPPELRQIEEGLFSSGVVAQGKHEVGGPHGTRHGLNDYTGWFVGDVAMEGTYLGYDGPCPPWNDSLVHHYTFTLYALDLERCPVEGEFTAEDVRKAIEGHVLTEAALSGTYTLNPRLLGGT